MGSEQLFPDSHISSLGTRRRFQGDPDANQSSNELMTVRFTIVPGPRQLIAETLAHFTNWFISKMGRQMDSTMKPTTTPITRIMTGSSRDVMASTRDATSVS